MLALSRGASRDALAIARSSTRMRGIGAFHAGGARLAASTSSARSRFAFFPSSESGDAQLPVTGEGSFTPASVVALRGVPPSAKLLGFAGLAPFVACAAFSGLGTVWPALGMSYGATILTFLGGPYWGLALSRSLKPSESTEEPSEPSPETTNPSILSHIIPQNLISSPGSTASLYVFSVVPSLVAWFATSLPLSPALYLLSASHAGMLGFDLWMVKKGVMPGWYANLRIWLGAIAATCLFFMVPESEWSKKRKAARKEQKELELEERKRRVAEREAELERLKLAEMEAEAAILEAKAKAEERKAAQKLEAESRATAAASALSSLVSSAPAPAPAPTPAPVPATSAPEDPKHVAYKSVESRIDSKPGEKAVERVLGAHAESEARRTAVPEPVAEKGFIAELIEDAKDALAGLKSKIEKSVDASEKVTEGATAAVDAAAVEVKEEVKEIVEDVREEVKEFVEEVREGVKEIVEEVKELAGEAVEDAKEALHEIKKKVEKSVDASEKVTEGATKAVDAAAVVAKHEIKETIAEVKEEVREVVEKVADKIQVSEEVAETVEEAMGGADTPASMVGAYPSAAAETTETEPVAERKEEKKKAGRYSGSPWSKK